MTQRDVARTRELTACVASNEREAVRAEDLDLDDPAVLDAIDLVRYPLSGALVQSCASFNHDSHCGSTIFMLLITRDRGGGSRGGPPYAPGHGTVGIPWAGSCDTLASVSAATSFPPTDPIQLCRCVGPGDPVLDSPGHAGLLHVTGGDVSCDAA